MKGLTSSVDKTFAVLEHFTVDKPNWSITELTKVLDSNKSTIYRFLSDMKNLGVIHQNADTGKYSFGLKLFELGNRVQIQSTFIDKTHPVLVEVAKSITETVHIAIIKNRQIFYIDKVESPLGLKISTDIGSSNPLHATSLGKVLLAFSYANYDNLIKENIISNNLKALTEHTITNPQKLIEELKKIRKQKYAIDYEEFELGLICVGVPIFNQKNEIVASLSAAGPSSRFKKEKIADYVNILQSGADVIKKKIGNLNWKYN